MVSEQSPRVAAVSSQIKILAESLARQQGARDRVEQQLTHWSEKHQHLSDEVAALEEAQTILLALEGAWRKDFEKSLAGMLSQGLSLVFNEPLDLRIDSTTKAGASAVEFVLETQYGETDIMSAEGGSVVQVVSFLLRVLLTLAHRPSLRKIVVLDEPFGGLSDENIPQLAMLLRQLVDDTGIQILMVTHERAYLEVADRAYEVSKPDENAVVRQLKTCNEVHLYEEAG